MSKPTATGNDYVVEVRAHPDRYPPEHVQLIAMMDELPRAIRDHQDIIRTAAEIVLGRRVDPKQEGTGRHALAVSLGIRPSDLDRLTTYELAQACYDLLERRTRQVFPTEKPAHNLPDIDQPDLVTLDQCAAIVHQSKRSLERDKTAGTLPAPSHEGGGGKAALYDWRVMRPYLAERFPAYANYLPEKFPRKG
jgi:hypothetical protein